ncbi:MAG: tetratricopeptide repeat protein [Alistipes sp.]|nr:tetratricopeptide repeat protein [Alistipes sp.]
MKKLFLAAVALMTVCAVNAQNDLIQQFNDGVAAMQGKDFSTAVDLFDKFVDDAMDSEDPTVLNCVATAKKYIPVGYLNLGLKAAGQKDYNAAVENLNTASERAELYGETQTQTKAKAALAKVYQVQGGEAFNNKDYAAAAAVFAKGYEANPRNTDMALNLAMSYCESGEYEKGMDVYRNLAGMNPDRYKEVIDKANEMMALYTNNEVAKLQAANDYDGIVSMTETMLAANPYDALAHKVRLQAYNGMKNYDKVIELGDESADAQVNEADRSDIYFLVGAAYNVKENKDKAVAYLKKVTSGSNLDAAQKSIADLTK